MDVSAWSSLIASVGFPIAAAAALFYFMVVMLKEHKEEINTLRDALEANTLAITKLEGVLQHGRSED